MNECRMPLIVEEVVFCFQTQLQRDVFKSIAILCWYSLCFFFFVCMGHVVVALVTLY